jgi:hypothetical protein
MCSSIGVVHLLVISSFANLTLNSHKEVARPEMEALGPQLGRVDTENNPGYVEERNDQTKDKSTDLISTLDVNFPTCRTQSAYLHVGSNVYTMQRLIQSVQALQRSKSFTPGKSQ